MARKKAQALFWIDLETDCLPNGNDFSNVDILEAGAVVTDFDLNKFKGVHDVVKLTQEHVTTLKKNPEVTKMHKDSGLLVESAQSSNSLEDLEQMLVGLLKDCTFDKGEYVIAGSGVATFDFPLIKEKMPELASWLAYFPLDIGILRRTLYYFGHGRSFVPGVEKSWKDGQKNHRAWDDVLAHIEEGEQYRDWLRNLPE